MGRFEPHGHLPALTGQQMGGLTLQLKNGVADDAFFALLCTLLRTFLCTVAAAENTAVPAQVDQGRQGDGQSSDLGRLNRGGGNGLAVCLSPHMGRLNLQAKPQTRITFLRHGGNDAHHLHIFALQCSLQGLRTVGHGTPAGDAKSQRSHRRAKRASSYKTPQIVALFGNNALPSIYYIFNSDISNKYAGYSTN